jgi:hypothetical protein
MMHSIPLIFAYFSPETFLPMTSILASAVGVLLLFGRNLLQVVRRLLRIATVSRRRPEIIPRPHFRFTEESVEEAQSLPPDPIDPAPAPHGAERGTP